MTVGMLSHGMLDVSGWPFRYHVNFCLLQFKIWTRDAIKLKCERIIGVWTMAIKSFHFPAHVQHHYIPQEEQKLTTIISET